MDHVTHLATLAGADLGVRTARYDERDAIIYALAVGAHANDLDLVFERNLRVLPTFGLTLGLWVADAAAERSGFGPEEMLHGSQQLTVHRPLPPTGEVSVKGSISGVWDKGKSTVFDAVASSEYFTATYTIVVRGRGGWGGERGPSDARESVEMAPAALVYTSPDQAALYRLTGDRHLIHIDPDAAREAGFNRPILHGLCTLGTVARQLAAVAHAHPCDLEQLDGRFTAPVLPGETIEVLAGHMDDDPTLHYGALVSDRGVLSGRVKYRTQPHR